MATYILSCQLLRNGGRYDENSENHENRPIVTCFYFVELSLIIRINVQHSILMVDKAIL